MNQVVSSSSSSRIPSADFPLDPALVDLDLQDDPDSETTESEDDGPTSAPGSESGGRRRVQTRRGEAELSDVGSNYEDDGPESDENVLKRGQKHGSGEDDVVFSRLAGAIARAPPGTADLMIGQDFQDEIARAEEEDLPQPTRRQPRRRAKRTYKPSHEVQRLLGKANLSYATGSHEVAINLFLEIIRMDPYVYSAWTSLASCYEEMEPPNLEGARQMRFFAAHVDNDWETWKGLAGEFRGLGQMPQCVYCLRKALVQEPGDVDTLYELATIYRLQGNAAKAVDSFKRILRAHSTSSNDLSLINEFLPLYSALKMYTSAAQILRRAFDFHLRHFLSPSDQSGTEPNTLRLEHVIALADMLLQSDKLEEALTIVKRGQRWVQGRKEQKEWDRYDDDREYDPPGVVRDGNEKEDDESEGFKLDVNLRHRLALIRLRLGDDDEAMLHVDEILSYDVIQHQQLYFELGNALIKRDMWEKALDCLATIQECDTIPDDPAHIYLIGICHHQLKEFPQALEALRWVVAVDENNLEARLRLANVLEDLGQKAEALDIVTEVLRERAHRGEYTVDEQTGTKRKATKSERAASQKLTKRVLEDQMRARMHDLWDDVQAGITGIEEGDPEGLNRFIFAAGTMIENFRLARGNFSKNRGVHRISKTRKYGVRNDLQSQARDMQDRLERVMGFEDDTPLDQGGSEKYRVVRQKEFYGLGFEEWLALTVKYCCVLMVKGEEDVAMDILEHVVWSGLFNNRRSEVALRMTMIACAMRMKAYDKIVDNSKRLTQMHQFRAEPINLMLACLAGGGIKAHLAWQNLQIQKFLHRELRIHNDAVSGRKMHYHVGAVRWSVVVKTGLSHRLGDVVEDDDEPGDGDDEDADEGSGAESAPPVALPKKPPANFNALYGQHMLGSRGHQSSLFYLFRAYESAQQDPFICLSIAQAFLGRTLNRQVDNRNFMMAQAMAFLTKYRKYSGKTVKDQEEVEYNYGRAFHGIGVPHLAIKHYERVLTSVETRMSENVDPDVPPDMIKDGSLACDAAHNLMLLYAASGSMELARQKGEWLAI